MGMFAGVVTHLLKNKGFQTDSIFIEGAIPREIFMMRRIPTNVCGVTVNRSLVIG